MLVSTHDLGMVQELFPRMVIMDEGKIVADGLTAELLEDEGLLEAHGLEALHSVSSDTHPHPMK